MSDVNSELCKGVADYMLEHARDYKLEPTSMWIVGFLHKVGEISQQYGDDKTGGVRLFKLGFKYSNIVAGHDMTPDEYCRMNLVDEPPIELILLWQAINHTNENGEMISYEEKLESITDSEAKARAEETIEFLKEWEENWRREN